MRHVRMQTMVCALLIIMAAAGASERFTLTDGRVLVGDYDAVKGVLVVLTGNGQMRLQMKPEQIANREQIAAPKPNTPILEAAHSEPATPDISSIVVLFEKLKSVRVERDPVLLVSAGGKAESIPAEMKLRVRVSLASQGEHLQRLADKYSLYLGELSSSEATMLANRMFGKLDESVMAEALDASLVTGTSPARCIEMMKGMPQAIFSKPGAVAANIVGMIIGRRIEITELIAMETRAEGVVNRPEYQSVRVALRDAILAFVKSGGDTNDIPAFSDVRAAVQSQFTAINSMLP